MMLHINVYITYKAKLHTVKKTVTIITQVILQGWGVTLVYVPQQKLQLIKWRPTHLTEMGAVYTYVWPQMMMMVDDDNINLKS